MKSNLFLVVVSLVQLLHFGFVASFGSSAFNSARNNLKISHFSLKDTEASNDSNEKAYMGKADLVSQIANETGQLKKDVEKTVEGLLSVIKTNVLDEGKSLRLREFGTFKLKKVASRTGRNPKTGETLQTKAYKSIVFTPSPNLKIKEE